jgi:hypothetical protein
MNNINSPALFRSLIVYAVCVPLAIVVGWTLTNPLDYQSVGFIGVLAAVLVFPLLMKWHYPLLIFSWTAPLTVFFLPGHPFIFMPMVMASLSISVVERILNKDQHFLPAGGVRWPLLAMLAVVVFTAEMTGGFGLRSFGSDVYGGRKYVTLIVGILSVFAITARPIPKKYANLYITLFYAGPFIFLFADLYPLVPPPLHFIYLVLPISDRAMDEMGNFQIEFGVTRTFGVATAAVSVLCWMLARHGVRGIFQASKPWRPLVLALSFVLMLSGGFRSTLVSMIMLFGLIFYMEKMHRTGMMLVVVMCGILGGTLLVPLASHLPYTFQRSLAWLPLDINPEARIDAESSTEWRVAMWQTLLPMIPKYLLLGKGFSFTPQTFNESMGRGATFKAYDEADEGYLLSSDFHNGPLSVLIPFGIWGVLTWLWYLVAGGWVVWRNYRYGDPDLRHLNMFLFAFFVSKVIGFFLIFGSFVDDVAGFGGIIGLSIAFNHGVMRPKPQLKPQPKTGLAGTAAPVAIPTRPAFQR